MKAPYFILIAKTILFELKNIVFSELLLSSVQLYTSKNNRFTYDKKKYKESVLLYIRKFQDVFKRFWYF